jgi:pimeloyl-ACP methyl ester carboxylesterase
MAGERRTWYDNVPAWAAWATSMVNAAVGDTLHARGNGLAVDMAFYAQNRPLAVTPAALGAVHAQPADKVCVFVHGLGCHEGVWSYPEPDRPDEKTSYGAALQAELGHTPFFVRYNTGLPLTENGAHLAALLDELMTGYPRPIAEIVLIGHSMGGLVIRSACHAAAMRELAWVDAVRRVFYLGSPHGGAPLEKLGYAATAALHAVPHPITRLIGDIFDLRSQGIKDLRHGRPLGGAHAAPELDPDGHVPWLVTARHYLLVATLTDPEHVVSVFLGDGLVRVESGHGRAAMVEAREIISPAHVRCFPRMHHLQLAHDPAVGAQIVQWCREE